MKISFLTSEQVAAIHDAMLAKWGGATGDGHRGISYQGVEAAVQGVKNSYYTDAHELAAAYAVYIVQGVEAAVQGVKNSYYTDAHELAAAYAVYIVQGHVFQDGNKRLGQVAMDVFLESNGLRSSLGNDEVKDLMVELQERAERGERTDALVSWLADLLRG